MGAAPLTLYLDLYEGKRVDLETVSRIALNLSCLAKEAAYLVEPNIKVRLELISGSDSSLGLNNKIETDSASDEAKKRIYIAIKAACALIFTGVIVPYYSEKLLDRIHGEDKVELSEESKKDIEKIVQASAREQLRQYGVDTFRALERDPAVKGVGVTDEFGTRPKLITPREDFKHYSGDDQEEEVTKRRITYEDIDVLLLAPWLDEDKRRWKFKRGKDIEFGAYLKDADFLHKALNGLLRIPISKGLRLNINLQTKETFEGGVWVIKEQNVIEVYSYTQPQTQEKLNLGGLLPKSAKPD